VNEFLTQDHTSDSHQLDKLEQVNNLAKHYHDNKQFDKALEVLSQVELPDPLKFNLAKCYYYTKQADKALEIILPLEKDQEQWIDTALYYNALGEHDKAYEIYKTLDHSNPKIKFNTLTSLIVERLSSDLFQLG